MAKILTEETFIVERKLHSDKDPVYLTVVKEGMSSYNALSKELSFNVNESPAKYCWRLAYSLTYKFAHLIESYGVTSTIWNLFCGTETECRDKAKDVGLIIVEDGNEN